MIDYESKHPSWGCHWYNRWWHRRLRNIDREIMIPILLEQVSESDHLKRTNLIKEFLKRSGQEHWLCECSIYAYNDLMNLIKE